MRCDDEVVPIKRKILALLTAVVALLGAALAGVLVTGSEGDVEVTASSSAPGYTPSTLVAPPGGIRAVTSDGETPEPAAAVSAEATRASRSAAWRSDGEAVGAWVRLRWPATTRLSRVEVRGAGDAGERVRSMVVDFGAGGSVLVTADADGDMAASFPPREVTEVTLTVAEAATGATSVALAAVSLDDPGPANTGGAPVTTEGTDPTEPAGATPSPSPSPSVTAPATTQAPVSASVPAGTGDGASGDVDLTASASSAGSAPVAALVDGDIAAGDAGAEWLAAAADQSPWVQLSWGVPREVASVQIAGPSHEVPAPSAPLHGVLRFDDGSTVVVSGIAGGEREEPTTIAFTPRMASSVRLDLARTVPTAVVGLRELAVHRAGTTPPRWPASSPGYATTAPDAGSCSTSSPAAAAPATGRLTLVCPAVGSAVQSRADIVVAAPPGTALEARAWRPDGDGHEGEIVPVATGTAGANGRAVLSVDVQPLSHGPLTVKVHATGGAAASADPLAVQLVNRGGRALDPLGHAPAGMTLQWAEEFTQPLSATGDGRGATYAASKPEPRGASQFGEAVFADPAAGSMATMDGHLRIRAQALDPDHAPTGSGAWGQRHQAGLLSSARVGSSGFAAQYGYFEARMMGGPGRGTWPAFWMLNTEAAARDTGRSTEVDAVELYGHNPYGSCHTFHNWGSPGGGGRLQCMGENGFDDWTMAWHTYGVRILPGEVVFTIDGVEVHSDLGLTDSEQPFFFLLDLALGGGYPVDLSATGQISDLYVDWVRVYT